MTEPGDDSWVSPGGWGSPAQPPRYGQPPPQYGPPQYGPPQYGPPAYPGGPPPYPSAGLPFELRPGIVPLRPLALGDILDGSFSLVRKYPRQVLTFSLGIALFVALVNFGFASAHPAAHASTTYNSDGTTTTDISGVGSNLLFSMLTIIISNLATLVLASVVSALVGEAILGRHPTAGQLWARVRPHLGTIFASAILVGIFAAVAVIGLLVGTLVVLTFYAFITQVAVLERATTRTCLRRSASLVKGSFWRTFGILLLAYLISGILNLILSAPFIAIAYVASGHFFTSAAGADDVTSRAIISVGGFLASALTLPFIAAVHSLLYVDQRMRREGLDVSLRQAAGATTAP